MMLPRARKTLLRSLRSWITSTLLLYIRNSVLAGISVVLISFSYAVVRSVLNLRANFGSNQSSFVETAALFMAMPLVFELFRGPAISMGNDGDYALNTSLKETPATNFKPSSYLAALFSKIKSIVSLTLTGGIYQRLVKPLLDFLLAGSLVLILLPMLCLVTLAVLADGGPAFYAHTRIGRDGKKFRCYKFRTMRINSDVVLAHLLNSDPIAQAEWHSTHKLRRDPRVTRVGRFLRATSLDELPQLFNVLRFEMSLIGPRPIGFGEVNLYGNSIEYYLATRPGITGLWQVSGPEHGSYNEKVRLDVLYAKNRSFIVDLTILMRTLSAYLGRTRTS